MVQHQETTEPETSEVIRLAQQMYERDRAEQARQSSLMAAAEEVGIPSEYLTKATAQLKSRQIHPSPLATVNAHRTRVPALFALALALATGILLLFSFTWIRAEVPAPPIMIAQPAAPVMAQPMGAPSTPQPVPAAPAAVAIPNGGG